MPAKAVKKVIKKRPPKTLKERKFVKAYIETGNAAESVRQAGYDVSTLSSATSIGHEKLTKLDLGSLLEKHGLTDDKMIEHLQEGMNAYKRSSSFTEPDQLDPDFATRHKWWSSAANLKGWLKQSDTPSVNYVQMIQNQNNSYHD
jgi:hypothetical protein